MELALSEKQFRVLIENSSDAVALVDAQAVVRYVSPAVTRILGYTVEEFIGINSFDLIHPDDLPATTQLFAQLLQIPGSVVSAQFQFRRKDGTWCWLESAGTNLLADPSIQAVVVNFRDIGERRRAEAALRESEQRYRTLVEHAPEAIVVLDADDGHFVDVNENAVQLFGLSREALLRLGPIDLSPATQPDGRPSHEAAREKIREALAGGTPVFEWSHRNAAGKVIPCEVRLVRLPATGRNLVRGSVTDITERKQLEEERNRLHARERASRAEAEAAIDKLYTIQIVMDATLSPLALNDLLAELLGRIRVVLKTDTATILLLSDDKAHLKVRASVGLAEEVKEGISIPMGQGIAGRIAASQKPLIVEDLSQVEVMSQVLRKQVHSLMGVPLLLDGLVMGVLHVGTHQPRRFSEDDLRLLQMVAERAASAIERAKLYEKAQTDRAQLQVLSRQLIEAQEAERRNLARELHDEIGQVFTALKINLQALKRTADPASLPRLDENIGIIDQAIQQVRDLSLDLRPAMLDDLGLASALRWYVDRQAQRSGLAAQFSADPSLPRLPPTLETACFRIAQEALTNIVRHAQAQQVWVELTCTETELVLVVRDDGTGFDLTAARERATRGASLGLLGMHERVQLVGGQLEIQTWPGAGTQIRVRFPLASTPSSGDDDAER